MTRLYKDRVLLILAASLSLLWSTAAQKASMSRGTFPLLQKKAARIEITEGPSLESYRNNGAIVRWTSNNPGGTDEHFGVVNFGLDPKLLDQTAKSHVRLNLNHPYTVFRVRMDGLKPATTYYYTVDSMEANGKRDGLKSPVSHFTTPSNSPEK